MRVNTLHCEFEVKPDTGIWRETDTRSLRFTDALGRVQTVPIEALVSITPDWGAVAAPPENRDLVEYAERVNAYIREVERLQRMTTARLAAHAAELDELRAKIAALEMAQVVRLGEAVSPAPSATPPRPIDTGNRWGVGVQGEFIVALLGWPQRGAQLTKPDALLLAAYLVSLADDGKGLWQRTLEAVQNT